jgi:putative hydrolase of the HAD superfamily
VPTGQVRAIIFDIGRVLIRIDVARALSSWAAGLSLSPAELWTALEKDPLWRDWQEGRVSPRDWHLHLCKRLGASLTFEQFTEVWNGVFDPKPLQDADLFRRLSKKYRLALLSNTDPVHVAYIESSYDFFRFFPVRIYSCTVGAAKPSPLVYQKALQACRVKAPEAVYIDDIPAYVEAAQRLGMAGIPYSSPEQLTAGLRALGVDW